MYRERLIHTATTRIEIPFTLQYFSFYPDSESHLTGTNSFLVSLRLLVSFNRSILVPVILRGRLGRRRRRRHGYREGFRNGRESMTEQTDLTGIVSQ